MKNVTVTMDDEVARWARIGAAAPVGLGRSIEDLVISKEPIGCE